MFIALLFSSAAARLQERRAPDKRKLLDEDGVSYKHCVLRDCRAWF